MSNFTSDSNKLLNRDKRNIQLQPKNRQVGLTTLFIKLSFDRICCQLLISKERKAMEQSWIPSQKSNKLHLQVYLNILRLMLNFPRRIFSNNSPDKTSFVSSILRLICPRSTLRSWVMNKLSLWCRKSRSNYI